MELPSPLISCVNPFPRRVINRTIFFCNALELHECACCLLSFLYFHWLFPLLARETSSGNRSIYKSTRERVDSKGFWGRWRLHLMASWCCRSFFATRAKILVFPLTIVQSSKRQLQVFRLLGETIIDSVNITKCRFLVFPPTQRHNLFANCSFNFQEFLTLAVLFL